MSTAYEARSLAGRCANGAQRDSGKLAHALYAPSGRGSMSPAICGAKPGRLSGGWSDSCEAVTCPKCLARIAKPRAPRMLPATEQLLRAVAAGHPHPALPDLDQAVHREVTRRGWLQWYSSTEARLSATGTAVLALLDQKA